MFIEGTSELEGNLYFRIKDEYSHDRLVSVTYMYNGVLEIFKQK